MNPHGSDTIPSVPEQEAALIRHQMCRHAVQLLVQGHPDLARDVVRAGFVEQADVLGLDPGGWT